MLQVPAKELQVVSRLWRKTKLSPGRVSLKGRDGLTIRREGSLRSKE